MKIGLTIWMFKENTGGLYQHAADLVHELQSLGHDVVVVTRSSNFLPSGSEYAFRNESEAEARRSGGEIRHLRLRGKFGFLEWLLTKCHHRRGLSWLALMIFDHLSGRSARECLRDCDLVHHVGQSNALVGFAARRAARKLGLPFVVQPTVHPGQTGDSSLDLKLFASADRLFVHTKFEEDYLQRILFRCPATLVVGNGIPDRNDGSAVRFRQERSLDGPFVLYVGRKDRDKGYHLVYEAWCRAREISPDLKLVCMGPAGGASHDVDAMAPGFVDLGYCNEQEKHDALAACSCLCVPSEGESFGLIFMEAGRYRKPVIARRLPVLLELIGEDAALLIGRPGRYNHTDVSVEEIAEAISRVICQPDECAARGELLYQKSARFLWAKVARNFSGGYESLTEDRRNKMS